MNAGESNPDYKDFNLASGFILKQTECAAAQYTVWSEATCKGKSKVLKQSIGLRSQIEDAIAGWSDASNPSGENLIRAVSHYGGSSIQIYPNEGLDGSNGYWETDNTTPHDSQSTTDITCTTVVFMPNRTEPAEMIASQQSIGWSPGTCSPTEVPQRATPSCKQMCR